jgi:hypothetical protein
LTGALGGLTVDGDTPPVRPLGVDAPLGLFGPVAPVPPVPPVCDAAGAEPAPDGAAVPPLAADAVDVPQARATTRIVIANAERTGLPPCMGLGIGPPCTAV